MPHSQLSLPVLRAQLREFVARRDWAQFHTPKNLASALCVEAAELLEIFQWLNTGDPAELSEQQKTDIRHEMADVLNYLIMLADRMDIDLLAAANEKISLNEQKYPVELARGKAEKYTAYVDAKKYAKKYAENNAASAIEKTPEENTLNRADADAEHDV